VELEGVKMKIAHGSGSLCLRKRVKKAPALAKNRRTFV